MLYFGVSLYLLFENKYVFFIKKMVTLIYHLKMTMGLGDLLQNKSPSLLMQPAVLVHWSISNFICALKINVGPKPLSSDTQQLYATPLHHSKI